MYIDFILLFFDYFKTTTRRVVVFEWIIPLILSTIAFIALFTNKSMTSLYINYQETFVSLLGVLIGFSITVITLLISTSNENVEGLKKFETIYFIGKKKINLFDLLVLNFSYSIIIEILLIVSILFYPSIKIIFHLDIITKLGLFSLSFFLILHVLFLNLRNVSDLYFTLISKSNK